MHGGGFYNMQKYALAPKRLPDHLHWSYWESYSTWLTGFALFTMSYLWNASTYLIDKSRMDWQPGGRDRRRAGLLRGLLDGLRRHLPAASAGARTATPSSACWSRSSSPSRPGSPASWFAGRAAFLLVGAMMATTMSGNVFFWIIPGQRKNVQALREGKPVDPVHGQRGKQRSVHNTYFTLPVLFAMLSNHCSFTYTHKYNWIVLLLIMLGGAAIRQFFVVRHRFKLGNARNPIPYALFGIAVLGLTIIWMKPEPAAAPAPGAAVQKVSFGEVQKVLEQRCYMCHGAQVQMKNVRLDTARPGRGACAGGVPAGGGHQDHADEQRDRHHRRRAGPDRQVVRRRCRTRSSIWRGDKQDHDPDDSPADPRRAFGPA